MGLPHYAVEAGPLANRHGGARECPVCLKPGRWVDDRFVPDSDRAKGAPSCYCRAIHDAGDDAYAYDEETKTFLRRRSA